MVVGPYFNDTLRLGGAVIPNMTLAIGNIPSTLYIDGYQGIMGLGARLGEAIIGHQGTPLFHNINATFPTIYGQLQGLNYTSRRAFSIYMNSPAAESGTVLFGAVDMSKYSGTLTGVPVQQLGGFTAWAIVLTAVSSNDDNTTTLLTASNFSMTVILDTGAQSMYLPTSLYTSLTANMNAAMHANTPYVPCSLLSDTSTLFAFQFGADGPSITVPQAWLIFPFEYPPAGNPRSVVADDGTELCYLGVIPTEGPMILLGDTFIRSAYLVFDADNLVVGMAQATYGAQDAYVVTLPAGSGFPHLDSRMLGSASWTRPRNAFKTVTHSHNTQSFPSRQSSHCLRKANCSGLLATDDRKHITKGKRWSLLRIRCGVQFTSLQRTSLHCHFVP